MPRHTLIRFSLACIVISGLMGTVIEAQEPASTQRGRARIGAPVFKVHGVSRAEGKGLWLQRSDDGGKTWGQPNAVLQPGDVNSLVNFRFPTLAAATDGRIVLTWTSGRAL